MKFFGTDVGALEAWDMVFLSGLCNKRVASNLGKGNAKIVALALDILINSSSQITKGHQGHKFHISNPICKIEGKIALKRIAV
jgi:hypothetical protein